MEKINWIKCKISFWYFVDTYGMIYDATGRNWIPFKLWESQRPIARLLASELWLVLLKARQLGMTWLVLWYALWLMLFHPMATVLLFSRRDDEAVHMLRDRLKECYNRLPSFLQCRDIMIDNDHEWLLSNGSVARAFPANAGDSYTATLAIIDEADLILDLGRLLRSVKPTIDAGGQLVLLSRVDKTTPMSEFKNIYRAAKAGINGWVHYFLPWQARPERTQQWYETQKADIESRTGSLDDLYEQYPATDTEALAPRILDKRFAPMWLEQCYSEREEVYPIKAPAIPLLTIYEAYVSNNEYRIGIDPAEGNPTSDDSALTVIRMDTGEEVAKLNGRFQPAILAAYADEIGQYYGNASLMVERNNHGHAVLLWLRDNSPLAILRGHDYKEGWLSSVKGKVMLYDIGADAFRNGETRLHSFDTFTQLQSIEGATLRAPEGLMDDLADSYCLALAGVLHSGIIQVGENPVAGHRG